MISIRKVMAIILVALLDGCVSMPAEIALPSHEIIKPAAPDDLLRNMKYCLDRHLFLDKGFYTDANIKNVFGGEELQWRVQNDPTKQWAFVSGFGEMIPAVKFRDFFLMGVSVSFERTENDNGTVKANVHLRFLDDERLDFGSVQRIFGTDWEHSQEWLSPHTIIQDKKAENGNARIIFNARNHGVRQKITMEFSPSANLSSVTFSQEK